MIRGPDIAMRKCCPDAKSEAIPPCIGCVETKGIEKRPFRILASCAHGFKRPPILGVLFIPAYLLHIWTRMIKTPLAKKQLLKILQWSTEDMECGNRYPRQALVVEGVERENIEVPE